MQSHSSERKAQAARASHNGGALDISHMARPGMWTPLKLLAEPKHYMPRSVMLREGEKARLVYRLTSGMARLSRTLPDGQRQIVGFALPGEILGNDFCEHVAFSMEAIDRVSAVQFQRLAFVAFINAKPEIMKEIHALTARDLSRARDHMVVLGRKNADGKLAAFLIGLHDRQAQTSASAAHIPLAMTRQDIADFVGLTIETVSRTLSKFARQKLIVITPNGVRLLNEQKVRIMGEI